ncbi:MAG TPA: nitroreductase family protein [Steroidobacteraceae bacterium]|nr:nitroreductase family protein [Steroidobacteraceae bacterium]
MELLAAIGSRSSAARLSEPGPTPEHLARILDAAAHAPDHGRLRPWRFIVVDAALRDGFAVAAAAAKRAKLPSMNDEQFAAECAKMKSSPAIVVVGCTVRREQTKIPEIEQVIAAAAAAENLFLAAHDLGYGVMWKTGAAAYDAGVKAALGLHSEDHIVGIMHLGTRLK